MKRVAPASSARVRDSSSPRVVTITIGSVSQLVLPADELDDLDATDVRHVQVEHDELKRAQGQALDGFEPARSVRKDEVRARSKARDDHVTHHFAVIDDENSVPRPSSSAGTKQAEKCPVAVVQSRACGKL